MTIKRTPAVELEIQRIDLLYQQNITGLVAMFANSVAFTWIAWNYENHFALMTWATVLNLSLLARAIATLYWQRTKSGLASMADVQRWHHFITLLLFVSGLSWGYCGWISIDSPSPVQHIFAGLLVFGMSAGAIVTYAPSLGAMFAVVLPAVTIWGGGLILTKNPDFILLGTLVLLFFGLGVKAGRNLNRFVASFLRLNAKYQESEERLRMARDSSSAVNWDWFPQKDLFLCHGNLKELFDISGTRFEGTFDNFVEAIPSKEREKVRNLFMAAQKSAQETTRIDSEISLAWSDSSNHWIAIRGRANIEPNGTVERFTGIGWDVTTKNNEAELRHERDLLETSNKKQLVFLANVSHEIRTPLAAINGFSELILRNQALPAGVHESMKTILRNGKYLVSLVNDLLDLAKLETDQLYVQIGNASVVDEIKDCLAIVQESLAGKNLTLDVVHDTKIPTTFQTDTVRFRQILINLLVNAIKYTEQGSIRLNLACHSTSTEQGVFRLTITDTGIGMSVDSQRNLFQPFSRGENSRAKKVPGSGLGLALSRRLARNLGGDLKLISSTPGEGTTFELEIATGPVIGPVTNFNNEFNLSTISASPTRDIEPAPAALSTEAPAAVSAVPLKNRPRLVGKRILLVEDEPDLRTLMLELLNLEGAEVTVATNGQEAFTQGLAHAFNAILMDIKMPVMDGYEATERLRKNGYRQPIIALTAHASSVDRSRCRASGCDSYLSKPIDIEHLLDLINQQPSTTSPAPV